MANWYAVYTRPHSERKVADGFARKGIESYCPATGAARKWMGQRGTYTPLFPTYVFVRLNETQLAAARKVDGVINFVWWQGKPAVIRDIEIEMLKRFLEVHKRVTLEKTTVNAGEMVKLTNGHLIEQDAYTLSVSPGTAKLSLPSLGYTIISEVEKEIREIVLNSGILQHTQVNFG